jgi:hypothetical protein
VSQDVEKSRSKRTGVNGMAIRKAGTTGKKLHGADASGRGVKELNPSTFPGGPLARTIGTEIAEKQLLPRMETVKSARQLP